MAGRAPYAWGGGYDPRGDGSYGTLSGEPPVTLRDAPGLPGRNPLRVPPQPPVQADPGLIDALLQRAKAFGQGEAENWGRLINAISDGTVLEPNQSIDEATGSPIDPYMEQAVMMLSPMGRVAAPLKMGARALAERAGRERLKDVLETSYNRAWARGAGRPPAPRPQPAPQTFTGELRQTHARVARENPRPRFDQQFSELRRTRSGEHRASDISAAAERSGNPQEFYRQYEIWRRRLGPSSSADKARVRRSALEARQRRALVEQLGRKGRLDQEFSDAQDLLRLLQ